MLLICGGRGTGEVVLRKRRRRVRASHESDGAGAEPHLRPRIQNKVQDERSLAHILEGQARPLLSDRDCGGRRAAGWEYVGVAAPSAEQCQWSAWLIRTPELAAAEHGLPAAESSYFESRCGRHNGVGRCKRKALARDATTTQQHPSEITEDVVGESSRQENQESKINRLHLRVAVLRNRLSRLRYHYGCALSAALSNGGRACRPHLQ